MWHPSWTECLVTSKFGPSKGFVDVQQRGCAIFFSIRQVAWFQVVHTKVIPRIPDRAVPAREILNAEIFSGLNPPAESIIFRQSAGIPPSRWQMYSATFLLKCKKYYCTPTWNSRRTRTKITNPSLPFTWSYIVERNVYLQKAEHCDEKTVPRRTLYNSTREERS